MNNLTIVYLIRHSKKIDNNLINNTNNGEYFQNRREKIVLSVDGEKRAELLSEEKELENVNVIFSSNYARAIQTAKYLAENKNLTINIDDRFNERKLGIQKVNIYLQQYFDEKIKNEEGECRKEVTERMNSGFWDAVNQNKGKKIAIFTHGAAMTFLLMEWCKLEYIYEDKHKCLSFKNKVIVDKIFDAPEAFKIIINENNEVINIENLEFEIINKI